MSQGKSLLKNTFIYAIGNFGSKALNFLLLPLYSYYLSKDEFGVYDLIIATIALLVPLVSIQISESTYRWLLDAKDEFTKQRKAISSGLMVLASSILLFFILFAISLFFVHYQYTVYLIFLLLTSSSLPFFQQALRGLGKNKVYAVSGIINTFFVLVFNILFLVVFKFKIESLLLSTIIANALTIFFICWSIKLASFISIKNLKAIEIKEMIAYALPLIPNYISWWLINVADKYIILYLLGIEANGIYAMSSRFPSIISIVNSIFLMAWQDHSIKADTDSKSTEFTSNMFNRFVSLELSVVIFLISITPFIIKFAIDPKFVESYRYIPFMYIGIAYSAFAAYVGVGYQKEKNTKHIFTTTIIGGIINILISFAFLKIIGLFAPALGTFISFLVIYLIRKRQTRLFYDIQVNKVNLVGFTLLAIVNSLVCIFGSEMMKVISIVISSILFYFINRKSIEQVSQLLKAKLKVAKNKK